MNPITDYEVNPLGVLLFAVGLTPAKRKQLGRDLQGAARFRSETRSSCGGLPIERPGDELAAADELARNNRKAIATRILSLAKVRYEKTVELVGTLDEDAP